MLKIKLIEQLVCRTPAFGINQNLAYVWQELKAKIEESSPEFYAIIKNLSYDELEKQNDKTKFTIYKYLNRAKYRATPFGTFAAISLVPMHHDKKAIELQEQLVAHHFSDWSAKENLPNFSINNQTYLQTNSSIYFVGTQIRYLKLTQGTFELASVDSFAALNAVLLFCQKKTTYIDLLNFMRLSLNLAEKSTAALVAQMIALQLLQNNTQANITGEDYFNRLKLNTKVKPSNYIISERIIHNGHFHSHSLKEIPDLVNFFIKYGETAKNHHLQEFKNAFLKRFEQQEVSLAIAMDPELGIGYGDLAQQYGENELINDLKNSANHNNQKSLNYGPLQQFLLQKIVLGEDINLVDFNPESHQNNCLPNTFSLMFHLYQGSPVISHFGGVTANTLLGRFSHTNTAFENYCKEISEIETGANSEVVFFDVAYQAEKKVDNVNRRKQLYPYELPILSWSEALIPLDFNDILVSVTNQTIILKSRRLGKRLIPRIASAYNYTRSDLAVFRFLCDIQGQELLTNLTIKLSEWIPNLPHYPRVKFKNLILQPASWQFEKQKLTTISTLKKWFKKHHIQGKIKAGYADQSLCFDLNNEEDLWALLVYSKQQKEDFYITEALLDEIDAIIDEKGNLYAAQYIANYYHKEKVYQGNNPNILQKPIQHLPLPKWLYFEIYTHPAKSNELLTETIAKFISHKKNLIKKWFFIRYTDPSPHIRLRLEATTQENASILLLELNQLVALALANNTVIDYQLKTYKPEIQRYGHAGMSIVEQFFCADSKLILLSIKHYKNEEELSIKAIQDLQKMCELVLPKIEAQIEFTTQMAAYFAKEMKFGPVVFKKINNAYNKIKNDLRAPHKIINKLCHKQWEATLMNVINHCENTLLKEKMLADLIHMHINRMFSNEQRLHETVCYHYLKAMLITKRAFLQAKVEFQLTPEND